MANFEVKDFDLLKASLLNYIYYSDNALTDFNVGAVMRCMLEAVAQEEEEIYFRLWQGIQNAIQQSILYTFNFQASKGTFAYGLVSFGRDTVAARNITIPAGTTVLSPNGASYRTANDVTIQQNQSSVATQVVATLSGSQSNLLVTGTLMQIVNPVYGVTWVQNLTPLSGGTDTESQASVFSRFTNYIASLSKGTLRAIEYGASTAQLLDSVGNITEKVYRVKAYDYPTKLGYVDCYIENGNGSASVQLVNTAQLIVDGQRTPAGVLVDGWKSAGVIVKVKAVTPVVINLTLVLAADDFYSAKPYVSAAITAYFNKLSIGQPVNFEKLIADTMYSASGIIDITMLAPAGDVYILPNELAVIGSVVINPGLAINGNL